MIEVKDLSYIVESKTILSQITLSFKENTINGVIGRNGAGKSTLIKNIAGLNEPSHGEILFKGRPLASYEPQELARNRVVLSQEIPVSFGLSVFDILLMGRYPFHPLSKDDFEFVDQIIKDLELESFLETPYPYLSGGERQRVQFGRALCQLMPFSNLKGKVLFLDEPLSALDLSIQQKVLKYIKNLQKQYGLTVVFVLHDLNWISQYCDQVYLLEDGKLRSHGSPIETFTKENLKKFFNVDTEIIKKENQNPTIIYL